MEARALLIPYTLAVKNTFTFPERERASFNLKTIFKIGFVELSPSESSTVQSHLTDNAATGIFFAEVGVILKAALILIQRFAPLVDRFDFFCTKKVGCAEPSSILKCNLCCRCVALYNSPAKTLS